METSRRSCPAETKAPESLSSLHGAAVICSTARGEQLCPMFCARYLRLILAFSAHTAHSFCSPSPFSSLVARGSYVSCAVPHDLSTCSRKNALPALMSLRGGLGDLKPRCNSAIPGTLEVEDQPVLTPLNSKSNIMVVGASRGIGLTFVHMLLAKGCKVIATHRDVDPPQALKDIQHNNPGRLELLSLDVASEKSISDGAAVLKQKLQTSDDALTHIIHNAGIYGPKDSFDGKPRYGRPANPEVTKMGLLQTFETNAIGPVLVAQAFVPLMRMPEDEASRVPILAFLTSKVGSVDDNNSGGAYAYRASKSALNIIAKSLYCDLLGSVSVFLLHPGYVRTDMTGGQGLIDTEESVRGMLKALEATNALTPFRWVDYKACRIPW